MNKQTRISWRWLSSELKRREVYPVIVAYAIVGWILLQIGEVTFDPLGVPAWVMPTLIAIVVAGFPVALALIAFHVGVHGVIDTIYLAAGKTPPGREEALH